MTRHRQQQAAKSGLDKNRPSHRRGSGGAAHARGAWGVSPQIQVFPNSSGAAREGCAAANRQIQCDNPLAICSLLLTPLEVSRTCARLWHCQSEARAGWESHD
jgi:hypothetical protein